MVDRPLVHCVVLNWNRWEDTIGCLDSLRKSTYPRLVTTVVDNGSTDGSAERIRKAHPDVGVIDLPENVGFAAGNNVGIRRALDEGAGWVWVLNNDTSVEPDALDAMVREGERSERTGIVGSVLYYFDEPDKVQAWGGGRFRRLLGTADVMTSPGSEPTFITGASSLLRAEMLEDVGLYDESYFFYVEDVDLSFRAHLRGWRLRVAADSKILHKVAATLGITSPKQRPLIADEYHARSSGIFIARHGGWAYPFGAIARTAAIIANRIARGQADRIRPLLKAFRQGLREGRTKP